MVDLDSNPTKLIEIVEVGKQLLITRGALTTFSIANDVAKYFAILPAVFISTYAASAGRPRARCTCSTSWASARPRSAIISAIIFNALVIPLLIPLSLRGVRYRPIGASALLRRNLLIYGLGGLIAPFIGIKLIDLIVHNLLGAEARTPATRARRRRRCVRPLRRPRPARFAAPSSWSPGVSVRPCSEDRGEDGERGDVEDPLAGFDLAREHEQREGHRGDALRAEPGHERLACAGPCAVPASATQIATGRASRNVAGDDRRRPPSRRRRARGSSAASRTR